MAWWRRQRVPTRHDQQVFAMFLVLAVVVLSGSLIFSLSPARQSLFSTQPSWQRSMPETWLVQPEAATSLDDSDLPSYVVGYADGAEGGVALMVWNRSLARYEVTADIALSYVDARLQEVVSVRTLALGEGASPAAVVTAALADGSQARFYVTRRGQGLEVINLVDSHNQLQPAVFVFGQLPNGQVTHELQDVNADGALESVLRGQYADLTNGSVDTWNSADVYVWRNGRFEFDKELSWALTEQMTLFPEPSAVPADTADLDAAGRID